MAKTKWILDPTHSELGFKIKHLMISNVSGAITKFQAEVEAEENNFKTATIRLTADMASITTHNEQRDAHLRNGDFFDTERFPELQFNSTKIEQTDEDSFILFGELTMKGITRPVQLHVEYSGITQDPWGNIRAGFSVSGKIKRSDWGVTFNTVLDTGGVALSEDVKVLGEIQLVKQVPVTA